MKGSYKLMGKSQKRYVWVDYIKIFACLLVVFGHLYMSMMAGGWIKETARYYCWPVQTIYTFHVPLFFICSGFLYQASNKNKEWTLEKHIKNVKRKLLALGVPYFTFSIITLVLKIVFSSEVNNQATPILRTLFIEPIAPYWYLYTLFFLFCMVPYFKDKQLIKKLFVGAVLLKVLYVGCLCNVNLPDILNKILANLVWFLLGMLLSEIYISKTLIKIWISIAILGVGLGISWIYYAKPIENNLLQFVIGTCMIVPILYFFMSISPEQEGKFTHKLNQYFMPIYVLHTIIAAMLRSILLKIGITSFILHFSIEFIASILIPIVIYEIASKNWMLLFWFEPVKALKMKRKKMRIKELVLKSIKSKTLLTDIFGYGLIVTKFADKYLAGQVTMYRSYSWLKKRFWKEVQTKEELELNEMPAQKDYVWFCWLQGIDSAPKLVQDCYNSIRYWLKDKEIIVITKENYKQYVEFPGYIIEKWKKGIISNTHFSDLLRLELLIRHGGLWLDATTYLTGPLPSYIEDNDFFVYRNGWMDMEMINMGSWLMYSKKSNNYLLIETRKLLYKYWEKYNFLKNYFLLHMFFRMVTDENPEEWEKVPMVSQIDSHYMMRELDKKYNEERCIEIMKITSVHKLTYKFETENIENKTADNLENLYRKLN